MYGQDVTVQPVSAVDVAQAPVTRPEPAQRVVERSAESGMDAFTPSYSTFKPSAPSEIERLAQSAREFAELLDLTGNVAVASSASGFRAGTLDLYA